eukprot:6130870-Pyramimonas_sp.AAC.1
MCIRDRVDGRGIKVDVRGIGVDVRRTERVRAGWRGTVAVSYIGETDPAAMFHPIRRFAIIIESRSLALARDRRRRVGVALASDRWRPIGAGPLASKARGAGVGNECVQVWEFMDRTTGGVYWSGG